MKQPKIALVYDRINTFGGAERVLQVLHKIWPDAPLYTSVYDPKSAKWAKGWDVRPSFLQNVPLAKTRHQIFFSFMPYAFESLDLSEFDIVLSVTSAEAKGVITGPNQLHVCYMLTPTRYLWSHSHEYSRSQNYLRTMTLKCLFSKHRQWDFIAAQRPDKVVAISDHVAKRIEKYYRRKVDAVIYPPVNTAMFGAKETEEKRIPFDSYYLVVSRLVDYKSIEIVIEAFEKMPDKRLVIVGEGRDRNRLQAKAGNNILFAGAVSDAELVNIYQNARALIFPQEEDFGITAVEAQAAGIGVIAYNKGGATETVIEDKTGVFFDKQSSREIIKVIKEYSEKNWYSKAMYTQAYKFDTSLFISQIKSYVEETWQNHLAK